MHFYVLTIWELSAVIHVCLKCTACLPNLGVGAPYAVPWYENGALKKVLKGKLQISKAYFETEKLPAMALGLHRGHWDNQTIYLCSLQLQFTNSLIYSVSPWEDTVIQCKKYLDEENITIFMCFNQWSHWNSPTSRGHLSKTKKSLWTLWRPLQKTDFDMWLVHFDRRGVAPPCPPFSTGCRPSRLRPPSTRPTSLPPASRTLLMLMALETTGRSTQVGLEFITHNIREIARLTLFA